MSTHSSIDSIVDEASHGAANVMRTARGSTDRVVRYASALVHAIRAIGPDEVLGVVGLQRKRSAFSLASFAGGFAAGAGVATVVALTLPQSSKAGVTLRQWMKGTLAPEARETAARAKETVTHLTDKADKFEKADKADKRAKNDYAHS